MYRWTAVMGLEQWNKALLEDVMARGQAGVPLYLYVDRELLGKLSGLEPAKAVSEFVRDFQAHAGREPFRRGAEAAQRWRRLGFAGAPPLAAHLAMTVLAVTEEPVGPYGIYRRQNQLLGLDAVATAPPGYDHHVPVLWQVWNDWLDGPGAAYGARTARAHPRWTLQGWARSQGLIRHSERRFIEEFLDESAFPGDGAPPVQEFLEWLRYRGATAFGLLQRFAHESTREILQEVLADEAKRWRRDGFRVRLSSPRRGLLQYDEWEGVFSGVIEVAPAWHGVPLDIGHGQSQEFDSFDRYAIVGIDTPAAQLLEIGYLHELTDRTAVQFGGREIYVFRNDPSLGGRLQCRGIDQPTTCHVLAHRRQTAKVAAALREAGLRAVPQAADVAGWSWFLDLRLDPESDLLTSLNLARFGAASGQRISVVGGLPIGPHTYLVGGEPDVDLPVGGLSSVRFDGEMLSIAPNQRRVSLSEFIPEPGDHVFSSEFGRIRFQTISFARETARTGRLARPIRPHDAGYEFGEPARDGAAHAASLSGADLRGVSIPEALTVRCPPGGECLVLTAEGDIRQVWPSTPQWLREIGLEPASVDVMHTIRSSFSHAAYFVVRSGLQHVKHVLAIPSGAARLPGHARSQSRQDLVPEFVAERGWRWVGEPDKGMARVLEAAMRRRQTAPPEPPMQHVELPLRADVTHAVDPRNPYDDVLKWLSEREDGRASYDAFAESWSWACGRYDMQSSAGQARSALLTLMRLGHVEPDWSRRQVAVSPAVLVALPAAAGLHVLAGARPLRLLERIDDPDDDDPAVAAAVISLTVHYRNPRTAAGQPLGPTVVYVEWDGGCRDRVRAGLGVLGVSLSGQVPVRLLEMQPSLDQAVVVGQQMEVSPGADPHRWSPTPSGGWQWVQRNTDAPSGFYQYTVNGQKKHAWRDAEGIMTLVSSQNGQWLARASYGHTELLTHDPIARRLLAPANARLPELIDRALTLRTGLPPCRGRLGRADQPCLVYENVDAPTAHQVAALLKQDLRDSDGTLVFKR
ncbi:hypothetical protein Lfu02_28990 [Longispora fulva]|uniref:Uncharacterized protein n=1 Tax=Longispora fulva TaxID=619741 RepID=A0A8J7GV28_9ACTN|nr:hypothetical protein [Longispora fulva]MBG6139034.1 hypothetical protein [Longispora fulva]GIG58527.1 hypothetical protein Lfu02_28990 [Longispora fulva]